jgi:hypothetical protein
VGAVAQERSQYDAGSDDACVDYNYHMKFDRNGKGVAVLGPSDLTSMLSEFTLSFWIYPTSLNTESVLINIFERIFIVAQSGSNDILFKFQKSSSQTVEPDYAASGNNNDIIQNTWNYVTASQREFMNGNIMYYK